VPKWDAALDAIELLVNARGDALRFGLVFYPDTEPDACGQTEVTFPARQGAQNEIVALLEDNRTTAGPLYPDDPCRTPVAAAMQQIDALLIAPTRAQFSVLISDGHHENCGAETAVEDTVAAITSMRTRDVETFVIGFDAAADEAALDAYAVAGGRVNPDPAHEFYPATDADALADALLTVADQTIGCVIVLNPRPEDVSRMAVFVDEGEPLASSQWSYDDVTGQLTLVGATCDATESGAAQKLDVVYSCP
jgi:hypothetical protein